MMFPFADKVRGGKLKYESYIVDKKTFLEECKNAGLQGKGRVFE